MSPQTVWECLRFFASNTDAEIENLRTDTESSDVYAKIELRNVHREVLAYTANMLPGAGCSEVQRKSDGTIVAWDVVRLHQEHLTVELRSSERRPTTAERSMLEHSDSAIIPLGSVA